MDFFGERLGPTRTCTSTTTPPTSRPRSSGSWAATARGRTEVDDLLRRGVLVDLLRAVRQSLRASVESYSIKKMEVFYGFTREIDLRDAGSSIVAFEQWLELGEGERPANDHLDQIEKYNRDDVVSTLRLRDWLETLRGQLARRDRARASRGPGRAAKHRIGCPTSWPGPRRSSSGSPTRPSSRSIPSERTPSRRASGCWPSSLAGIGARTRRRGGNSSG